MSTRHLGRLQIDLPPLLHGLVALQFLLTAGSAPLPFSKASDGVQLIRLLMAETRWEFWPRQLPTVFKNLQGGGSPRNKVSA